MKKWIKNRIEFDTDASGCRVFGGAIGKAGDGLRIALVFWKWQLSILLYDIDEKETA